MPYKIIVSPVAKNNVKEAVNFYCENATKKLHLILLLNTKRH
jgi:hypothetical protein